MQIKVQKNCAAKDSKIIMHVTMPFCCAGFEEEAEETHNH